MSFDKIARNECRKFQVERRAIVFFTFPSSFPILLKCNFNVEKKLQFFLLRNSATIVGNECRKFQVERRARDVRTG